MKKNKRFSRHVNGVLLFDKPIGITSNTALQWAKDLYQATKAGHTGSLDPLASGMLPICFGEATKFAQFLLEEDKTYRVTCQLGVTTTTDDAEGETISVESCADITLERIIDVLPNFQGAVEQLPPMYSAIKHHGQPLYKLARQGIVVERSPRVINIYDLGIVDFHPDTFELMLYVHCSKGTYVRTLVSDIGKALGCGGHVSALRRASIGHALKEQNMVTKEQLMQLKEGATQKSQKPAVLAIEQQEPQGLREQEDAFKQIQPCADSYNKLDELLLPVEIILQAYPVVTLTPIMAFYVMQGQPVMVSQAPDSGYVQLKTQDGRFLGVGEIAANGLVAPRRLMAFSKSQS